MKGKIRIAVGYTLRVTGCSGVTVNQSLISGVRIRGDSVSCRWRQYGEGSCNNESGSYLSGTVQVHALCNPNTIYYIIISNVSRAKAEDDPEPRWEEPSGVTVRAATRKANQNTPLCISSTKHRSKIENKKALVSLQKEDQSVQKYRNIE